VNFLSFHAFAVSEDWRGPGTQVKPEAGRPPWDVELGGWVWGFLIFLSERY